MATKKTMKQKKRFGDCRECLVCGGKTISAHLGMDVCRACSVFYRRSVGKRVYECRSGKGKCEINNGETCRKCRFERIEKLLANSGQFEQVGSPSDDSSPAASLTLTGDGDHTHRCEPSSSNGIAYGMRTSSILDRVRSSYRTMCQVRLTSELLARPEPPHPMLMNEEDCQYLQATFGTMNTTNRILLSSGVAFGKMAFPELVSLSKDHQWAILRNFFYRFGPFESSYRADKMFPNEHERLFAGYTYWFTHNYDEHFYSDCPNPIDVDHVKTSMHNHCKTNHTNFRSFMKRLRLTESEFLYLTSILFWTTENLDLPENVVSISEQYRSAILQEFHGYYREELCLDNYATRLGELLAAIQLFDKVDAMKENFEFLRLMNVFSDDSFLYRLHRDVMH